jgi:hypothetical protein
MKGMAYRPFDHVPADGTGAGLDRPMGGRKQDRLTPGIRDDAGPVTNFLLQREDTDSEAFSA